MKSRKLPSTPLTNVDSHVCTFARSPCTPKRHWPCQWPPRRRSVVRYCKEKQVLSGKAVPDLVPACDTVATPTELVSDDRSATSTVVNVNPSSVKAARFEFHAVATAVANVSHSATVGAPIA